MVESFVSLCNELDDQSDGMKSLLKRRGIYLPAAPEIRKDDKEERPPGLDESVDTSEDEEDDLYDELDMLATAQAAANALQMD
jgi:hypothetical protein